VDDHEFNSGQTDVTPEQVRRTIQAYVKTDSHDVDQELLHLWRGSDEGRPSASEADMALIKQLYYWCKGDQQLMDQCFRASGRMRLKWDQQRGDSTYGEMTIQKVSRTNNHTFDGKYIKSL
jgi:putative DNA primase/helicase